MKLLIVTQKVDKNDQLLGFFIDWLERWARKFESILVLCLEKGHFDLPNNVRVISLGKEQHRSKIVQLFNFYQLIFKFSQEYDAILVHMNPIWMVLGGPWWRLMGKKNYLWYTHKAVTAKLKLAEKLTDVVFTASSESFRLPSKKVIVTGHGIDTDFFKPNHNDQGPVNMKLKLLSVGRIAPVKNYETLIAAAKILAEKGFIFEIGIIGEAPMAQDRAYEIKIKEKIKTLKLENYFVFLGKINHQNLPAYFQSYDLFIHLSKTGSLDKSLLEAMASGIKVLSSNDWSQHNLPSELVFNENNPLELASKIEDISKMDFRIQLRELVIKNHNLSNLIEKISLTIHEKKH